MLGLSEQLLVLMFAHLLLAPLNNVSHRLTSFFLIVSVQECLIIVIPEKTGMTRFSVRVTFSTDSDR